MRRPLILMTAALFFCLSGGCSQDEPSRATGQAAAEATRQQAASPSSAAPAATRNNQPASVLERWQPAFDPSAAEHTYLLSCIGHPDIEGVAVGFNIRDEIWARSNGRLYVDYRPLAQLGGEKDVLSKLRMGAVQGMLSSSVAAANLDDRLGLVNLPFLIDTPEKLEKFRNDPELFGEFGAPAASQGILVADFTGYGSYGWASRTPVTTLEDARKVNFRIAQAPVNTELYKAWKMKFTVMPWPDVPQALQTGVIDGLDHTPTVCSISRKFDSIKNFTFVNYAQGLYVHLVNRSWLDKLPEDLQQIFLDVVAEQSALSRQATQRQEAQQIDSARAKGVNFWPLSAQERETLTELAEPIYRQWAPRVGEQYLTTVQAKLGSP